MKVDTARVVATTALLGVLTAGISSLNAQTTQPAKSQGDAPKTATLVKSKLLDPKALNEKAPETFRVKFETTKGDFVVEATRAWAPNGVDRFYNLVKNGYYDDIRFFRVIPGFMAQFGIHGDPAVSAVWREANIPDDKVAQSNKRGYVTFATAGPGTRTTQLFINYADKNSGLDAQGFSPIGRVVTGMDVVDKLNGEYGEGAPGGKGPNQGKIQMEGNAYLTKAFAKLDYIKKASLVK